MACLAKFVCYSTERSAADVLSSCLTSTELRCHAEWHLGRRHIAATVPGDVLPLDTQPARQQLAFLPVQ